MSDLDKVCEICKEFTVTTSFEGAHCDECGKWICEDCMDIHFMRTNDIADAICNECAEEHADDYSKAYCRECGEIIDRLDYMTRETVRGVLSLHDEVIESKSRIAQYKCPKCEKVLFNDYEKAMAFIRIQCESNPVPREDRV